MSTKTNTPKDPLFVIFEHRLYEFQYPEIDRKEFIISVLQDYFKFLRKFNITVYKPLEEEVYQELYEQVEQMLVKKMYGFTSFEEFKKKVPEKQKKRAKELYIDLRKR